MRLDKGVERRMYDRYKAWKIRAHKRYATSDLTAGRMTPQSAYDQFRHKPYQRTLGGE